MANEGGWMRARLRIVAGVMVLAPVLSGAFQNTLQSTDGAPGSMVAFFSGTSCPPGWSRTSDAQGRLLVGTADAAAVGSTVATPLGDREDRPHAHAYSGTVTFPSLSISAAAGSNSSGAAAGDVGLADNTLPATSGLPFIQLLVCEKP